jgi:exosortase/archaeosortase
MEILESLPILLKVINLFFYIEFVWQSFSRFVVRCVLICTTDLREKTTAKETTLASKVVITGWNVTSSDTFSTRYVQPRSIFSTSVLFSLIKSNISTKMRDKLASFIISVALIDPIKQ